MPTYENIVQQVIEAIKEIVPPGLEINPQTDLISDLEFDSLKVMNLMEDIEDRFDISIPLNILPDVRSVEDLAIQLQHLTGED
ncbi:MAG: acyl carrier protein [Desulfobacterales bacterium]|nr:acyl carrier protein [Desulfobacterales bacterium]